MLVNDTFSISAIAKISNNSLVNFFADLGSSTVDNISALVFKFINKLQNGICIEVIIASYLVLIQVFVALISVIHIYILLFRHKKTYLESGQVYIINPVTKNLQGHNFQLNTAAPLYKYPINKAALYIVQPRPFLTFKLTSNTYSLEAKNVG